MLFISVEDFLNSVKSTPPLTREEEKALAARMAMGDADAREALRQRYLPMVAAHICRAPREIRTLHTVYAAIVALDTGLNSFNFQQSSETFAHHLGWRLRQCIARCLAEH